MAEKLKIPPSTREQQFKASDPANSSWLSANAGSGKTHVLTQRVIRLMLDGNAPDRIMCLTFTKAAAANMKNRVFETLSKWTMMESEKLDEAIEESTGKRPSGLTRITARQLFARALDTPGGLKIQTIHGFCESLLHQFPLEANVPGHFETVQELEQADMLARATAEILAGGNGQDADIALHYEALIPHASDAAISNGISAIVSKREPFLRWVDKTGVEDALADLYEQFGISPDDTKESIQQQIIDSLPVSIPDFRAIIDYAERGTGKSDRELVERLYKFLNTQNTTERFDAISAACLTQKGELRTERSLATKAVKEQMPDLVEKLQACGSHLIDGREKIHAPQLLKNSYHLFKLGYAVLERYQAMKRRRGIIDFDDQIERTANLLNRSDIRDWIRYRLDRGVDHILVDEAQDTSPAQWQIINAICDDFHSGQNASARNRTIFVVGDEKQSIFSFQGAEPREFDLQEKRLRKRVNEADKPYHPGQLQLSFRSTQDVLHAVDKVFENKQNRFGLTRTGEAPTHDSIRETHAGEVQVWPLFGKSKAEQTESWLDPVDHAGEDDPAIRLAKRIAGEIKALVGKPLLGMNRALSYKDILVLVRSRDRFITALIRTMKDEGLAVAGADRLKLTQHVAVEDMLAIGRAAILPQDDLSLACTLKSLFFNFSEETLFAFANGRDKGVSLFNQIGKIAQDDGHPHHKTATTTLKQLTKIMELARTSSVFEFYARLLGEFGGRRKILARLGSEAEDVIDAFVDEALTHTLKRDGGLENFLSEIIRADPEIKREVELNRDEVRILTVHASKGLEAPVVFLVDSCGPAWREAHRPALLPLPPEHDYKPYLWLPSSKQHISQTKEAIQKLEIAAQAEYRRLLYVGMTRAADRLIVCGYHGIHAPKHEHWHKMVFSALEDTASEITNQQGEIIGLRWVSRTLPPIANTQVEELSGEMISEKSVPDWLFKPAKTIPPLPRPLTPSGASVLIDEGINSPDAPSISDNLSTSQFSLQKGNVTHKLLEVLPELEPENRRKVAQNYLAKTVSDWSAAQKHDLLHSVFSILEADEFKTLFAERAQAEVSVAGWVETKLGRLQISGQIDRLVVSSDQVTILDYKTNYLVPENPDNVPIEYQVQLALYRDLVRQIYPKHRIVSALMWTQTPLLMVLPDNLLDRVLHSFKNE